MLNIFNIVKELNFPQNSYVVVGSGHLAALGLKESNDVDIVVTPDLFEKCMLDPSWKQVPWTYEGKIGQVFLRKDSVELYLDVNAGNFNPTIMQLLNRAVVINGVTFASLEDILSFKKEYIKTKPKHLLDIKLLEEYLVDRK